MKIKIENLYKELILESGIHKKIFNNLNLELDFNKSNLISILSSEILVKSTLLKIISGLMKPDSGKIIVNKNGNEKSLARVVYIPKHSVSIPWINVKKNIEFGLKQEQLSETKTKFIISLIGLDGYEEHIPDKNSHGFRFRIVLGRALYSNPDLILLDDPFNYLDQQTKGENFLVIKDIIKETRTKFLLATNNLSDSLFLSDEIILLDYNSLVLLERVKVDKKFTSLKDLENSEYFLDVLSKIQLKLKNFSGYNL